MSTTSIVSGLVSRSVLSRFFIALSFVASVGAASTPAAFAAGSQAPFPKGPDQNLTPGALCQNADAHRYPEKIAYCNRDVDTSLKREIFRVYDRELGYSTTRMNRMDFKIDHYIPLCAGGSNEMANLWPQHKSVYTITDELESLVCVKMAEGRILQKDAVDLVRRAKNDLSQVDDAVSYLHSL